MLARGFQTYGTLSTAWSRSRWGPGALGLRLGFGLRLRLWLHPLPNILSWDVVHSPSSGDANG